MKKVLIWIGIALLIWFIGYGFFAYRQQQSYKQLIARQSSGLLRIQVDKLLKDLAWNTVLNPLYFKGIKKDTGVVLKPWKTGLKISANVFLYTLSDYPRSTFFTKLKINDYEQFKRFIERELKAKHLKTDASGIMTAVGWGGRLSIAYTKRDMALCFSPSKELVFPALQDLLNERGMLEVQQSSLFGHTKGNGQAIYWSDSLAMTFRFTNGALKISGNLKTNLIRGADSLVSRKFDGNSLIKMWLAADVIPLISQHRNFFEKHRIPVDTLINYYGSYVDLEWKNQQVFQTDTIVSYDYNDNFDRVEKRTIRREEVPEIYIALEASPHLAHYLPQQMLYKFYHGMHKNRLYFGTATEFPTEKESKATKQFFYLFADVRKLRQQKDLIRLHHYFPKLKTITCTASRKVDKEIQLEGQFYFHNKSVNSLLQI